MGAERDGQMVEAAMTRMAKSRMGVYIICHRAKAAVLNLCSN